MNAVGPDSGLHYLEDFTRNKEALPGRQRPWVASLREAAMRKFVATGFPTRHDEDWKYTSVVPIEKGRFTQALDRPAHVDAAQVEALALHGAHLLVFVDGHHVPTLSQVDALPAGVSVASLASLLERRRSGIETQFDSAARYPSAFAALNVACMTDGACIHLAKGVRLDAPIHLLFLARTGTQAIHTRNLVFAEADSQAIIVEHHAALGAPSYFTNTVTDIVLGRGAQLEHHKLQQESAKAFHIAAINADLAGQSRLLSTSFALGGALARTDIHAGLNGEGAECTLDGLYVTDGRQHIDHHTRVDHNVPRGTSRELYKGVLNGASRAVFNGKVVVHPDAQQSDAAQTNRNLLLSEHAEIDTKPQLEIWADDVKCSHAATVGQLDAAQVFYLRSRGLDEETARALLTYGFAAEMVQRVDLPRLRQRLDTLLRERLPQQLEALP